MDELDPSIVALTKAIGSTETGGNYTAKGASGEYGAYQYTPATWAADSQTYLGQSVPLDSATPAQQDEVAYNKVKALGAEGNTPSQIASIWNSGKADPTGNVGVNKEGVAYNTPAYVQKVQAAYQKNMGQGGGITGSEVGLGLLGAGIAAGGTALSYASKTFPTLGALSGEVAGVALAPETGGLSLAIPAATTVLGAEGGAAIQSALGGGNNQTQTTSQPSQTQSDLSSAINSMAASPAINQEAQNRGINISQEMENAGAVPQ